MTSLCYWRERNKYQRQSRIKKGASIAKSNTGQETGKPHDGVWRIEKIHSPFIFHIVCLEMQFLRSWLVYGLKHWLLASVGDMVVELFTKFSWVEHKTIVICCPVRIKLIRLANWLVTLITVFELVDPYYYSKCDFFVFRPLLVFFF